MPSPSRTIASPVGALTLVAGAKGLAALLWGNDRPGRVRMDELVEARDYPVLDRAECELAAYFGGERTRFTIALEMAGTDFQKRVWAALLAIPYGQTRTYGALARGIGRPAAARAVGAACGRNPVSIIVPCHRAVGSDGSLTGFAGGLDVKRRLLELETGAGLKPDGPSKLTARAGPSTAERRPARA